MTSKLLAVYHVISMRIGLLSDTHIPEAATELPPEVMEAFQGVDLILHAGDIYSVSVLDDLEKIAPVLAARGDDDYGAAVTDKRVKEKHVLKIEGRTLWLIHGRPLALYISAAWWRNRGPAEEELPDIVVFGHEHRTVLEQTYDILFVSPGSPTFLNYRRGLGTIGILDLDSGKPDARIIQL